MARRVSVRAAVLAAMLFLAACGGDGSDGSGGGSSPSGSASTGGGSTTPAPTETSGGPAGGGEDGFAYPPWGPDDPPIPGQYTAFAKVSSGELDCAAVQDQKPGGGFWDTALAVCYAIRDDASWPPGTSVPPPPQAEHAYQDCLNAELAAMLADALRWHAANPGRRPVISFAGGSTTSPCQSRIRHW